MMAKLKKYGQSYTFVLLLVMLAMIVVMSFVSPYFLTLENFKNSTQSIVYLSFPGRGNGLCDSSWGN